MVQHSEAALPDAGVGQGRERRSDSRSLPLLMVKGSVALVGLALNAAHRRVV